MSGRRLGIIRSVFAFIGLMMTLSCQEGAPRPIGVALVYAAGELDTSRGRQAIAIRFDRQACLLGRDVNLRDASGLGVFVLEEPAIGWGVRRFTLPAPSRSPQVRGFLNVAGLGYSLPLARGTAVISRATLSRIDGDIDVTVGQPTGRLADTTKTRVRVVGRFSATERCDP